MLGNFQIGAGAGTGGVCGPDQREGPLWTIRLPHQS